MRKAFLVTTTFISRVVVDEDLEDPKNMERLVSQTSGSILAKLRNMETEENITEIKEDVECPYGTFNTDC